MQNQGIRDARSLGTPKMLVLGLQHMFAMFGCNRARACADGAVRLRDAAVRRSGHALFPLPHEG